MYNNQITGYEEKNMSQVLLPVRIHTLTFPPGTDPLFYLHWHEEFEFFLVTEGSIKLVLDDQEILLHTGECAFIRPNQLHAAYGMGQSPCQFTAFVFHDSMLTEYTKGSFYEKYIYPVLHQQIHFFCHLTPAADWQAETLQILYKMTQVTPESLPEHELLLKSHLLHIWHLLYRHPQKISEDKHKALELSRLKPALSYIHSHYMDDLKLSEIAGTIAMSDGQFCRLFKKNMNTSPINYLMRYRVFESCRLLADTDKNISEIANLTGFNNISYYNKVFLKTIGCTPSIYRKDRTNIIRFM